VIIFALLAAISKILHLNTAIELKLMKGIRARNAEAFSELYDLYSGLLYGLILSIVKKRAEAEDLLHELFLQVWEKPYSLDTDKDHVYGWLTALARQMAIAHIRSRKPGSPNREINMPVVTGQASEDVPKRLDSTIIPARRDVLEQALQEIPEDQRLVIERAYYHGYTREELALLLDISPEIIGKQMHRGMIKLKNRLQCYIS